MMPGDTANNSFSYVFADSSGLQSTANVSVTVTASGAETIYGTNGAETLTGTAQADLIFGYDGDDRLRGGDGNDTLIDAGGKDKLWGENGNDRLEGGISNDTLAGGAGNDVFVFKPGFGKDEISDFAAGPGEGDVIEFDHAIFQTFAQVYAASGDTTSGVKIRVDVDNNITLRGVLLSQLSADDFIFV